MSSNNFLSKLGTYLPIAAVGVLTISYATGEKEFKDFFSENKIVSCIIGGMFIVLPLIIPIIYNKINSYRLIKRNLTNIIVNFHEIIVDINDGGKKAFYYEKVIFGKLGEKKNHLSNACMTMEVGGKILPQSALNCSYNLNTGKNVVQIEYVNNSVTLNKYDSIVKKQDKFLIFTAILKDSFTNNTEYWDLIPRHYCKDYNLHIILNSNTTLKKCGIYKINNPGPNETETLINKIPPIISHENGRTKITMKLVDYDYGEQIRLKWQIT